MTWRPDGPEVLLCTAGSVRVERSTAADTLRPGGACWLPASTRSVTLSSTDGATVFRTRVGDR